MMLIIESHNEKSCLLNMQQKGADLLPGNHTADVRLCFCYVDSTIPLLPISKISTFYPSSMAVQPAL